MNDHPVMSLAAVKSRLADAPNVMTDFRKVILSFEFPKPYSQA
jgi:hypothetical protein